MESINEEYGAISLRRCLEVFWQRKWMYGAFLIAVTALGLALALILPDRYVSHVLLLPTQDEGSSGAGVLGSNPLLQGAAEGFLGKSMLGGGVSESVVALETIKTHKFISEFVERHDIIVPLMAAESWNPITKKLKIDTAIYDPETKEWTRKVGLPFTPKPNAEEVVKEFRDHLSVDLDPDTSVVTIKYEAVSPYLAQQWLEWLLQDVNSIRKEEVRIEKEKMLSFLHEQLRQTRETELQRTISGLIGQELKTLTLLEARDDYVFRPLDPPIAPNRPAGPKRAVIVVLSFIGALMIIFMAVLLEARFREESV